MDRSERTVLTTGANSGIGLATVVHLMWNGMSSPPEELSLN
jgi:NAD(P)-dependent dehydrogenase (short-subunit alcohol dehydrogenase family)